MRTESVALELVKPPYRHDEMHAAASVRPVSELFARRNIDLPERPGVYAFWWIGPRDQLLNGNRRVVLQGPNRELTEVEFREWWPLQLTYPCLYVGKATNLKKRFSQHVMRGQPRRLHAPHPENLKVGPSTTTCQLRWGIEHVFPREEQPLSLIFQSVGFSYRADYPDAAIAERMFELNRFVWAWRPWFNIEAEH